MKQQTMVVTMAMKSTTAEAMPAMVLGLWDPPGMSPRGRGGAGPARGLPNASAQHPVPLPSAQYQCPASSTSTQYPIPRAQYPIPRAQYPKASTQHPCLQLSTQVPAPEGEAVALLALGDEAQGVAAAVPVVARAAAEGVELAVEAGVPGPVLVHVPQAVLASHHWGQPPSPGHLGAPGAPPAGQRHPQQCQHRPHPLFPKRCLIPHCTLPCVPAMPLCHHIPLYPAPCPPLSPGPSCPTFLRTLLGPVPCTRLHPTPCPPGSCSILPHVSLPNPTASCPTSLRILLHHTHPPGPPRPPPCPAAPAAPPGSISGQSHLRSQK